MASSCNHLSKLKNVLILSLLYLSFEASELGNNYQAGKAGSYSPAITTRSNTALGNNYLAGRGLTDITYITL